MLQFKLIKIIEILRTSRSRRASYQSMKIQLAPCRPISRLSTGHVFRGREPFGAGNLVGGIRIARAVMHGDCAPPVAGLFIGPDGRLYLASRQVEDVLLIERRV